MSELTKMNLIAIVQQLPKEDIEFVQTYITIMEDKIKELENINDKISSALNVSEQRIDKAIEYIWEAILGEHENGQKYYLKDDEVGKNLLSILKGENNE